MYGYQSVLDCGWKTGVHDCRALSYEHPWLAVCQETQSVVGCWSRAEARDRLREIKTWVLTDDDAELLLGLGC